MIFFNKGLNAYHKRGIADSFFFFWYVTYLYFVRQIKVTHKVTCVRSKTDTGLFFARNYMKSNILYNPTRMLRIEDCQWHSVGK